MVLLFLLFLLLQIAYGLYVFIGLFKANRSKLKLPTIEKNCSISVLVVVKNEYINLKDLIPALLAQSHTNFEVLILDDGSTDGTQNLVYSYSDSRLRLHKINDTPAHINSKKRAIEEGIALAKHENIVVTDADCILQSNSWLSVYCDYFSAGYNLILGFSPYEKKQGLLNAFIRYETNYTALQYLGAVHWKNAYMGVGRNMGYKKALFTTTAPYEKVANVTGGDDDLFVNQIGKQQIPAIAKGSNAVVYSKPKTTWKTFFKQKIRHLNAGQYYKPLHKIMLGLNALSLIGLYIILPYFIWNPIFLPWVVAGLVIRYCLLWLCFLQLDSLFKVKTMAIGMPFLELLYAIYYITAGIVVKSSKTIKWN